MKLAFAIVLAIHGLLHLMGGAKAFRVSELLRLAQPISRPFGVLWLLAAALLFATAGALFAWPRWWWAVGAGAVILSQIAIATSWGDAKYGTIVNVLALAGVVLGFLARGPSSFRAELEREVERGVARAVVMPVLTEGDIAQLPASVQRYVRLSGAVGQPRVQSFHARFHGKIRSGPDAPWMSLTGEQYNFYDQPARLFLADASLYGVPFEAFHRFVGPTATMRVKVASLVQVVDAKGEEMDKSETVTLFNDLCVFAPGALVDRGIAWREVDSHTVSALFTNGNHSVRAVLSFNDLGELVDFISDDRMAASADGKSFTPMRWSTPLRAYRTFGVHRLMSEGECLWHAPGGKYAYLQFGLDAIDYNVAVAP